MYLLCFLYAGTLPVILNFINENIEMIDMKEFIEIYCKYRIEHKEMIHQKIKDVLPRSFKTAFAYIVELNHHDKPNYQMIKLWFAFN